MTTQKTSPEHLQLQFNALVDAYHKPLYRYSYWLCGDAATAEDILQETFIRAWRAMDSLQHIEAAKSWLITILRRENARRFQRKSLDYADVDLETLDGGTHASRPYASNDEADDLHKAIARLEPMYREPICMQMVLGLSQDEIAAQLELPSNTVATRLRRSRIQLREMLSGEGTHANPTNKPADANGKNNGGES